MIVEVARNAHFTYLFGRVFKSRDLLRKASLFVCMRCVATERPHALNIKRVFQESSSSTHLLLRNYSSPDQKERAVDRFAFENACAKTLDSLSEYFEELVETVPVLKQADVVYSDGVITVHLGQKFGTYVINRQTPNLQIWLSSPTSGPKRYDFVNGTWIYKHDNTTLHSLLDKEIKEITNEDVQFVEKCLHGKASD